LTATRFGDNGWMPKRTKPSKAAEPSVADEDTLTDAQVEERRANYQNALVTVMGDDSAQSQQNAQYVEWAFDSLLSTFYEAEGRLTEEAIREILPNEVLRLGIEVDWIPYLDEDGEPYTDKRGDVDVHGYRVRQDFYDAFLRLLPVEEYSEYLKKPWESQNPAEIVEAVQKELTWGERQLVEAMQAVNGTAWSKKHGQFEFVDWQDSKEYKGLRKLRKPPLPHERVHEAQEDHRKTLYEVIRTNSKDYADITIEWLKWRRP